MVNMTDGQRETINTAKKFISDNNYKMNVLYDKDSTAAINYNIESIPRTLFIDKISPERRKASEPVLKEIKRKF